MEKPTEKPKTSEKPVEIPPAPLPEGEIGGSGKPEPTRYKDWEIGGKCVDF